MARARNIKPSLFKNEDLGTADPFLTILFEGLWCLADREGRVEDRPLRINIEVFPYRGFSPDQINGYLTQLLSLGFIRRYRVGEIGVIQVVKFAKHQSPHSTEKPSELPPEPIEKKEDKENNVILPLNNESLTQAERSDSLLLNPDLPNPESGNGAKPPVESDPIERRIWKDGIELLTKSGLTEKQARPLLGRLAKDYGEQLLAESIAATQAKNPADPKPFLIAVLLNRSRPNPIALVGKSDTTVECSNCQNVRFIDEGGETFPCPSCKADDYAFMKSKQAA